MYQIFFQISHQDIKGWFQTVFFSDKFPHSSEKKRNFWNFLFFSCKLGKNLFFWEMFSKYCKKKEEKH